MDCENYEALAVDLLYGEISPERRTAAESHAASCPECGKLSKELDEARKTAASLPARIHPPAELDERILLAARAAADVRKQPLRGSMLHFAAAAILGAILIGTSFVVGMRVAPRTHIYAQEPEQLATNPKNGGSILTGTESNTPPKKNNMSNIEEWRRYQEELLKIAGEDFAKGDFKRALTEFGGAFSNGGRTEMALEARIGMAKCFQSLGQLEEARNAARDAREKNMDWGTNFDEIEQDANKLIQELNKQLQQKQR